MNCNKYSCRFCIRYINKSGITRRHCHIPMSNTINCANLHETAESTSSAIAAVDADKEAQSKRAKCTTDERYFNENTMMPHSHMSRADVNLQNAFSITQLSSFQRIYMLLSELVKFIVYTCTNYLYVA